MKKKDVAIGGTYIAKVSGKLAKVRITGESRFGGWEAVNMETRREVRIRGAARLRRRVDAPKEWNPDAIARGIAMAVGIVSPKPDATATTTVAPVAAEPAIGMDVQEERGDAALPNTVANAEPQPTGQEGDETMAKKKIEKGTIACSKCGRVIRLEKQKKGMWRGRCECGQGYVLGKRLIRINGNLELPAATTVEQPKAPTSAKATAGKPEKLAKAKRERADGQPSPRLRQAGKMSGLDAAAKVLAEAGEPLGCDEVVKRMLEGGLWSTSGKTPAATIYAAIIREIAKKGDASRFTKTARGKFAIAK